MRSPKKEITFRERRKKKRTEEQTDPMPDNVKEYAM